jgi:hypothetical protein
LVLPGGLLLLMGWLLVRVLGRVTVRLREETRTSGEPTGVWRVLSNLSFRDVFREARTAL